jgi:hypothetical protein
MVCDPQRPTVGVAVVLTIFDRARHDLDHEADESRFARNHRLSPILARAFRFCGLTRTQKIAYIINCNTSGACIGLFLIDGN